MRYLPVFSLVALMVLVGCDCECKPKDGSNAGVKVLSPDEYFVSAQESTWGDIKGQVVWGGDGMPEIKVLEVDKDKEHCLSKGKILSEEYVINPKNNGIRYAVVWLVPDPPPDPEKNPDAKLAIHPKLKDVDKSKKNPMDQPCCKFEPRVVAMRQGEILLAKNSSPIPHNFKWGGIRNPGDNKLMPPNTDLKIDDLKASPYSVTIECNIHPWMRGHVRIFDHPYFAVTDADGNFEIKQAPAGKCRIVVHLEAIGYRTDKNGDPIEIKAGAMTDLGKYDLKPRKN